MGEGKAQIMGNLVTAGTAEEIEQLIEKFHRAKEFVGWRMINREKVIQQSFYAILTGDHQLLQSRTGAGKTMLAEQIFAMFDGVRVFRVQASKEQMPDTYFGALDIEELKRGRIVHNTEGSLVESEFGFIDEIFDANDYTLRALLSLLNERALIRGAQYIPAKVHTVIAATNYLRVTEITEAILDRFIYKALVLPDKDPYVQYRIAKEYMKYSGKIAPPKEKISYHELQLLHSIVVNQNTEFEIEIYPELLYIMNLVIRHYEYTRNRQMKLAEGSGKEFYISPRTQAKAQDLLRAVALWQKRWKVLPEDIKELKFLFATIGVEEEESAFEKSFDSVYRSITASNALEQMRLLLEFADLFDHLRRNPHLWHQPLHQLEQYPFRRGVLEWLKDALAGGESLFEQNKRMIQKALDSIVPVGEEVRQLKHHLHDEFIQLVRRVEQ